MIDSELIFKSDFLSSLPAFELHLDANIDIIDKHSISYLKKLKTMSVNAVCEISFVMKFLLTMQPFI